MTPRQSYEESGAIAPSDDIGERGARPRRLGSKPRGARSPGSGLLADPQGEIKHQETSVAAFEAVSGLPGVGGVRNEIKVIAAGIDG